MRIPEVSKIEMSNSSHKNLKRGSKRKKKRSWDWETHPCWLYPTPISTKMSSQKNRAELWGCKILVIEKREIQQNLELGDHNDETRHSLHCSRLQLLGSIYSAINNKTSSFSVLGRLPFFKFKWAFTLLCNQSQS